MEELENLFDSSKGHLKEGNFETLDGLNSFAFLFVRDVADIYDCITRIKNTERNPSGYSFDDASIIGLLVKIWKLLKEIAAYYERDNAEIISILERPLLESAITASYLMKSNPDVIEDYRKCSYKDRLRILRDLKNGSPFFNTKAGKRIVKSVEEKMRLENYTVDDFKDQKRNLWKLQGKSFFDIFKEVEDQALYASSFGMMSESIHCSWNDSMDWCLHRNDDGTFEVQPFSFPADIRFISPTVNFCNRPYKMWLKHIDIADEGLMVILDWIDKVNSVLFVSFDKLYDE